MRRWIHRETECGKVSMYREKETEIDFLSINRVRERDKNSLTRRERERESDRHKERPTTHNNLTCTEREPYTN